jgi:hypothetical protein
MPQFSICVYVLSRENYTNCEIYSTCFVIWFKIAIKPYYKFLTTVGIVTILSNKAKVFVRKDKSF